MHRVISSHMSHYVSLALSIFLHVCIYLTTSLTLFLLLPFTITQLSSFLPFSHSMSLPLVLDTQAKATVKRDGIWSNIDAAEVVPGDLVLLACGSAIPADSRINEGQIEVDQAALTGESLPVTMYKVCMRTLSSIDPSCH